MIFGFDIESMLAGSAAMWVLSAAAYALPQPKETSHPVYVFFFQFTHKLLANLNEAKKKPVCEHTEQK